MPNQYKNKVVYGDSVLMDITDTTAEAGDVASGAVFYAKNGARTVGTFTQAQSDWAENDTTDPAYILNKPTIPTNVSELTNDEGYIRETDDAVIVYMTLGQNGKTVTVNMGFSNLMSLFSSAKKAYFSIMDENYRFMMFEVSEIDSVNESGKLFSVIDGTTYTIAIQSVNENTMTGELVSRPTPTNMSDLTNDEGYIKQSDEAVTILMSGNTSSNTVTIDMPWEELAELIASTRKVLFALPILESSERLIFDIGYVSLIGNLSLFCVNGIHAYTINLSPNISSNQMVGNINSMLVEEEIDDYMSSTSQRPVENRVITQAIANNKGRVFYGTVDPTSTATAFTAQIPGITAYEEGLVVILKNGVVTSASGFTININGLGALPVYNNLGAESRETTIFNVAYTMMFVYENRVSGGDWLCYRGSDANTNTIGYQLRTNSMSLPMKSVTYRYRLLFTSADGAHFVPANNTTSTNATASRAVCQDKIDPFGPIYYYSTTASVAANSRPSAVNLWEQYTIALGYSFNRTGAALTLTPWAPVYVKCAPQADGSAIIDSTTPYVQVLPTTADGKIYIFLGIAYSATNIELLPYHPVYCYRNGEIQIWTGTQGAFIPNFTPSDNGKILSIDNNGDVVATVAPSIPSASSSTPLVDGTASAGSSTAYARADHVHPKIPIDSALSTTSENPVQNKVIRNALVNKLDVNTNYNVIPLNFLDPENPPATLDGATITCGMDFDFILEKYQLAIDTTFELMSESQNYNVIVFHPFRIDENDRSIELFSIFNRNIYTLTLELSTDLSNPYSMVGTLHVDAILNEDENVKPAFFGGQWINYGLGAANPQYGSHVLLTNYYIDGTLYNNTNLLLYAVPDYEISNTSSPLISLYKGYTESGIAITYTKDSSSPLHPIWKWDAGEHNISVNQAYIYMPNTIPSASSTTPIRDGVARVGTSTNYARADHVHPKVIQTLSMSNNVITLTDSDGRTSSVTLPVYDGTVTSGGGS